MRCILRNKLNDEKNIIIDLNTTIKETFDEKNIIYQNDKYTISVELDYIDERDEIILYASFDKEIKLKKVQEKIYESESDYHFTVFFDWVQFSYEMTTKEIYFSKLIPVAINENRKKDVENIEDMLNFIENAPDNIIQSCYANKSDISLDSISHKENSLQSYINLASIIIQQLEKNFPLFKAQSHHKLVQRYEVTDYIKASKIDIEGFKWILDNPEFLEEDKRATKIKTNKKYYPTKILSLQLARNFDVYENKIILGFLLNIKNSLYSTLQELMSDYSYINIKEILNQKNNQLTGYFLPLNIIYNSLSKRYESLTINISGWQNK